MTGRKRGGNEWPDSTVTARYGFSHTLGYAALEVGSTYWAHDLREQIPSLPQDRRNPAGLVEVHLVLGVALLDLGEFTSAWTRCEQGLALYDRQQHHSLPLIFGQHPAAGNGVQHISNFAHLHT
jgi:hypothetical protein